MEDLKQQLVLNDRHYLRLIGVDKVEDFTAEQVNLATNLGYMQILGEGLHICHLNLEGKEIAVEGKINAVDFSTRGGDEIKKHGKSFVRRLLK